MATMEGLSPGFPEAAHPPRGTRQFGWPGAGNAIGDVCILTMSAS
jgi:hypothetical protein